MFIWFSTWGGTNSFIIISAGVHPADEEIPEHVPFVLIGAGTASFAAYRAIKKEKPDAKVQHNIFCSC